MAARYWRLSAFATQHGDLELSELLLYDAGGRIDTEATVSSTIAPVDGTLAALMDGDLVTTCRFAAASVRSAGFAVIWDFGGMPRDAVGVRLGSSTNADGFLVAANLEYSSDGTTWVFAQTFERFAWPGPNAYTQTPRAGDASYQSVSLLLHCDGLDGGTSFVDLSVSAKSVAAIGGARIDSTQSKFGGASGYLNGAESYLQVPNSADLAFGTGDFTVEGWFRLASLAKQRTLFDFRPIDTNGPYAFLAVQTTGAVLLYVNTGDRIVGSPSGVPIGAWVHIACARVAGTTRLFVQGVQAGSSWTDPTAYGTGPAFSCRVGRSSVVGYPEEFEGHFDEVRITKGVGRYSGNFTPSAWPFAHAVIGATDGYLPAQIAAPGSPSLVVAASAPLEPYAVVRSVVRLARDVQFGGPGRIFGTTKAKASPSNLPTKARVVLLHQRSKLLVRETWSDPVTGDFVFEGLDVQQEFLALAEDAAGNFAAVAAQRLVPEAMP